jgi:hypothetical protein
MSFEISSNNSLHTTKSSAAAVSRPLEYPTLSVTHGIFSWLDELLWDIVILSTDTEGRSMAQTTDTNVLLETVAAMPYESPQPS